MSRATLAVLPVVHVIFLFEIIYDFCGSISNQQNELIHKRLMSISISITFSLPILVLVGSKNHANFWNIKKYHINSKKPWQPRPRLEKKISQNSKKKQF